MSDMDFWVFFGLLMGNLVGSYFILQAVKDCSKPEEIKPSNDLLHVPLFPGQVFRDKPAFNPEPVEVPASPFEDEPGKRRTWRQVRKSRKATSKDPEVSE